MSKQIHPLLHAIAELDASPLNTNTKFIALACLYMNPRQKAMLKANPTDTFLIKTQLKKHGVTLSSAEFDAAYDNMCKTIHKVKV